MENERKGQKVKEKMLKVQQRVPKRKENEDTLA